MVHLPLLDHKDYLTSRGSEKVESIDDVRRFFMVRAPESNNLYRLLVIGQDLIIVLTVDCNEAQFSLFKEGPVIMQIKRFEERLMHIESRERTQ
jgi:hypothetical protein